ncbi:YycH family regulatory protein [Ectobacillus ponti]|uniref:Two-component system activity regulator YycH n=1 Tax=Ectobacillus ponti TaxID=2961894 RepID=A0AA41XE27_9BACI|nr:two-component system activity regulator YycH [Ectobacillus ponti]MCP8971235.1 two-component system activity regulator YycH [Ectobacillus ponti]
MNIETFKTAILTVLVGMSLALTYSLWTYQPNSDAQSNTKYIQDVPAVAKKEMNEVVYPSRVAIHTENSHKVSYSNSLNASLYRLLEKGEFQNLHDRSASVAKDEFLSFMHGKGKMEFVFPAEISLHTIRKVLNFKDKDIEDYSFDRIVIDTAESRDNNVDVYFVSYEARKVYEAVMKGVALKDLEREQAAIKEKAPSYFLYKLNETKAVFLPEASTSLPRKLYVTSNLLEEQFKNVLFTDPRYVKKDDAGSSDVYTDGTRLLRIFKENRMLRYENPTVSGSQYLIGSSLVQQSVDFVNSHGGWSDTYRLDEIQAKRGKAIFRVYEGDLPVFNANGMAALKLTWGTNELKAYERPLFRLFLEKKEEDQVSLPSGQAIQAFIEKSNKVNMQGIEDINVGYELEPQLGLENEHLVAVKLNPIWYIKYNDRYVKVTVSDAGGEISGLEQN